MKHSLFRPALFFTALSAFLLFASPQNAEAAALTNGDFETGSFSPWVVSEISYTTNPAPAFVRGASFTNAMGVATNVTPAEGSYQAVLNAPTSGTTSAPDLETFLGLAFGALDPLTSGISVYDGGSAIKQTFDVRDGSVISFQWNFLPNGNNFSPDQNDSGFFTLHAAGVTNSTNYTVLSTTISSGGNPTGYQPYTTGPLTAGSYLLGFSAFDQQQQVTSWFDAQQPTLLIDAVTAYVPNLYVGSNSSGVTTNFTSGTNYYENTYVGFSATDSNNTLNVSNAATVLTNYSNLYVGYDGSGNSLVVSNGATVASATGFVGSDLNSSNNSVLVTGANSLWTNSGSLTVGIGGSSNSLVISNGGRAANTDGFIGSIPNSSNNSVLVTGANSTWTNSGELYVGYDGSSNNLVISNGGTVANTIGNIGEGSNSSDNSVLVTGTNSTWTNSGEFYVGYEGSGNSLVVSNGATVASAAGFVGSDSNSLNNRVLVTDGGILTNIGSFTVGNSGSSNSLVISNGGTVANANGYIGYGATSSNNSVLVTDAGSAWVNSGNLTFGLAGHDNNLVISNGGLVTVGADAFIGDQATASNNAVLVTGTNAGGAASALQVSDQLFVGFGSSGNSMVISDGGQVANNLGYIGTAAASSNNSVLVTGADSLWSNVYALVGYEGSGNSLIISNGGTVADDLGFIGYGLLSSNNSALVTGAGSVWSNTTTFYVGSTGSGNSLVISNGGTVASGEVSVGRIAGSSNNSVLVTGTNSTLRSPEDFFVGYQGSGNSLVISNGGTLEVVDGNGRFHIGYTAESYNNSVLVTGAGSTLAIVDDDLEVGSFGSNSTLTATDGGTVNTEDLRIANDSGSSGTLNIGRFGTNDTGGTIIAATIRFGDGTGVLNFNQSDAVTISSQIRGPLTVGQGTINQLGTGTTILSATNSIFTGATTVEAGKLIVDGSIAGSTVTVNNGGTLAGSGTVGGLIVNSGGTVSPGNSPGNLTVAGDLVWNGGGNYNWQVLGTTNTPSYVAGTTWDLLTVTGTLNLGALQPGNKFNINLWSLSSPGSDTNGPIANFNSTTSYEWLAVSASNITGFNAAHFAVNVGATNGTGGFSNPLDVGYVFGVREDGGNLYVTYGQAAPIPEPGTWAAMAIFAGGAAYAGWRRRKGAKVG